MSLKATRATKQQLGAYYTPDRVALALTTWAVTHPSSTILDPSFGGCAFLYSALEILTAMGATNPGSQIYGVDVDPNATAYLNKLIEAGASATQFHVKSFFQVSPMDFQFSTFDCVLGNPPYIDYHKIDRSEQKMALARAKEAGIDISARSSSWAFFIIHSLRFLRKGGRLAMVLPGSFTRADYALKVRESLSKQFRNVYIIFLAERVFEDTEEQAVILLADGYGEQGTKSNIVVAEVDSVDTLESFLKSLDTATSYEGLAPEANLYRGVMHPEWLSVLEQIEQESSVIRLGDWVTVRIGVVTGNNRFFIMSPSQRRQHQMPTEYFTPIVRRPAQLNGLILTETDVETLLNEDKTCLLLSLDSDHKELSQSVADYVAGASDGVRGAAKCIERDPWYSVLHRFNPPAFLQYMSSTWPRIVVNESSATCTNNIHRLQWSIPRPDADWLRLALGSLSTLGQLSAELVGRSYGSGVLKLEPKEVLNLRIPLADTIPEELVPLVDRLLREGRKEDATETVDQYLLVDQLGLHRSDIDALREAKEFFHQRRRK